MDNFEKQYPMASTRSLLYRFIGLVLVIGLGGLLVTASRLEPAEAGLGTHQQLGLPPCTIRYVFGVRCPACGMTTSWSAFTQGKLVQALRANVGGVLLAGISCAVIALALRVILSGEPPKPEVARRLTFVVLGTAGVVFSEWCFRLWLS